MSRFTDENLRLAREIIVRYPKPRSAMIPLLHLAQEQNGYVPQDAMEQVAELVGVSAAEVLGTLSFYEMFKRVEPGRYQVNVCHGISCFLCGAGELLSHAEEKLGVKSGGTTPDGMFSLEAVECIAACTEAPALQVNYRYSHRAAPETFDELIDALAAGEPPENGAAIPQHGVLATVRQHIPAERAAGASSPDVSEIPVWLGERN